MLHSLKLVKWVLMGFYFIATAIYNTIYYFYVILIIINVYKIFNDKFVTICIYLLLTNL